MKRSFLTLGGAALLVALVVAYAAFSLVETERKVLASAEAEGRALLRAVSAGVERSALAGRAVRALELLVGDRLLEVARDAGGQIAARPGQESRLLQTFARRYRLRGAVLLDADFAVVATAGPASPPSPLGPGRPPPVSPERIEPWVVADIVERLRAEGLGEGDGVVAGFGEGPFGARVEYFVCTRNADTGGYLLLRQDARALRELREGTGVEALLATVAESEAIDYLVLEDRDGRAAARAGRDPDGADAGRLDIALPAVWEEGGEGTLRVGLNSGPVEDVLERGRESIILFTVLVVLLGAGGAATLLLMDRSARRKREAYEAELRSRERAASMGRLAAGVAHEVRSPLNAIGMASQRLAREAGEGGADTEAVREISSSIRREVSRLNRTVEEFLDLGRPRPLEVREVDLAALASEVSEAEAPDARVLPPSEPVRVRADFDELRKAVANLVRNAFQAAEGGPVVVTWRSAGRGTEIEVRDGGPGIPKEEWDRVFDHFYTKRPGGTGLGLAIVRSIVERHGGRLDLGDAPEGGAKFVIRLPGEER